MNTFQQYKAKRMAQNPEFWENYPERFETFQLGVLLKTGPAGGRINPGRSGASVFRPLKKLFPELKIMLLICGSP